MQLLPTGFFTNENANCFGSLFRDSGHDRNPALMNNITGTISLMETAYFITAFILYFVVIDPTANSPIFLVVTAHF